MQHNSGARPALTDVSITEGSESIGVSIEVEFEDTIRRGAAAGTPEELHATCARATLRAVELGRPLTLLLAGARTMTIADVPLAVVVVHVRQMNKPMVGSAVMEPGDDVGAFVRATLDAINRAVELTSPAMAGSSRALAASPVLADGGGPER